MNKIPTVAAPPGYPGLTPPAAPKKRGKPPEQYVAELAAYRLAMREYFVGIASFRRKNSVASGITHYIWLAMDVRGTCEVAKRYDGKKFAYDTPPPEGHVGESTCGSQDWCRCIARNYIEGFR